MFDHDFLDRYSRGGRSPVHRADPRWKLLAALAMIVLVGSVPAKFWPVAPGAAVSFVHVGVAGVLVSVTRLAGIRWRWVLGRLAAFGVLVSFWAVWIPVLNGLADGWALAAAVVVKACLSFLTILVLVNTTPYEQLLAALARLGAPRLLVAALAAMYRYLFVLVDEAVRMRRARDARTFGRSSRFWRGGLSAGASVIGMLLVRSARRAQRVHAAMLARGFDGRIRALEPGGAEARLPGKVHL